jgi:hypothetical protein
MPPRKSLDSGRVHVGKVKKAAPVKGRGGEDEVFMEEIPDEGGEEVWLGAGRAHRPLTGAARVGARASQWRPR